MEQPNMSLLAYKMWKESSAEAVCIISNKKFTTKVVYDLEAREIPAYRSDLRSVADCGM